MKDLNNKIAVITGASAGIGRCIAQSLALEGCHVIVIARRQEQLNDVVSHIKQQGGIAYAMTADFSDNAQIRKCLRSIEKLFGSIDILVNNVGAGTFKPLHLTTEKECELAIQLPYTAAMIATHEVIAGMVSRQSGHIVNMTSPAGIFPLPFMVPYTAARHAMVGLSHSLYEELNQYGIGVSLVCPAQVDTGYFDNNDADLSWYPKISTIFPILRPEEVAEAVVNAIKYNRREVIIPSMLKAFVTAFRKTPRLSVHLLSAFGLWKPAQSDFLRQKL